VYVFSSDVPEFRYVIVSTGNNAVMGTDLESALSQLFPGFEEPIGDRVPDTGDDTESPTNEEPSDETSGDESGAEQPSGEQTGGEQSTVDNGSATGEPSALTLLDEAEALFSQADDLLRAGDLGRYQETIALAKAKVAEAIDALEG
jgi:uncharacterized membrane protein (UPF0182 family)